MAEPEEKPDKIRKRHWSATRRRQFLERLSATYDVAAAAGAAGMDAVEARRLRATDGGFADQWEEALAAAREQLRENLFAHALGHVPVATSGAGAAFDPQLALKVLAIEQVGAGVVRRGAPLQAAIDASLLTRLEELANRRQA